MHAASKWAVTDNYPSCTQVVTKDINRLLYTSVKDLVLVFGGGGDNCLL